MKEGEFLQVLASKRTGEALAQLVKDYEKRIAELEAALREIIKEGGHMSGGLAHRLVRIAHGALDKS